MVPDRTKDNRESFRALEVKILPPGTLTLEEETHKKLRGTVERVPTLPQRQSFGGREGTLCLLFLPIVRLFCHGSCFLLFPYVRFEPHTRIAVWREDLLLSCKVATRFDGV